MLKKIILKAWLDQAKLQNQARCGQAWYRLQKYADRMQRIQFHKRKKILPQQSLRSKLKFDI